MKPTLRIAWQTRWFGLLLAGGLALWNTAAAGADAAPAAPEAAPAEEKPAEAAETAEESAPEELTPAQIFEGGDKSYANWVEISAGGMFVDGDKGWAGQRQQINKDAFGGIQDLHFQQAIDKKTTLALDGHSIFGPDDYSLTLQVRREDLGYARFRFENFTTFYDTSGGYFQPGDLHFSAEDDPWELSRGLIEFEAGLDKAKLPKVVFRYTHRYRDGEKGSTLWAPVQTAYGLRGLYPGWQDIDERSDAFELDASYRWKATSFGIGARYETGDTDNRLYTTFRPLEPAQRHLTDKQGTSYDMLSFHAWTETWLKPNLSFSTGFLFANLDNDFSGSRIYGDQFDVGFSQNPLNPLGYYDLEGNSRKNEYVVNLNLMATPVKHLTVVPSLRVQKDDWDAESSGMGTLADATAETFTAESDRDFLEVRERVDLRYNGVTNWVFFAAPEWTQGNGDLRERGGLSQVGGIGVDPVQDTRTDDSVFHQKYSIGARWYPDRAVTVDFGGYYKLNSYDWDHKTDGTSNLDGSPDRYPAFLEMQEFETYDANLRLTLRPVKGVTLVSRYEYQESTASTRPGEDSGLDEVDSSEITSHIFGQNVSWTPWSRLTLQAGASYVISETETPTSRWTEAVLDAQNNYWTVNVNAGFVLDDRTDLNVSYFYYRADNYDGDSSITLPLGSSSEEHGITAGVVRRVTQNIRLALKYGFSHFRDAGSGGNNEYDAHLVYSSLQYRF